jgi:hypothetical protein
MCTFNIRFHPPCECRSVHAMSTTVAPLEVLVREWLRLDSGSSVLEPHKRSTRAEIQALWDAGNTPELEKRMRWLSCAFFFFHFTTSLYLLMQDAHRVWHCRLVVEISFCDWIPTIFHRTGLRGRMEAGWSRMNDLTVIQASQVRSAFKSAHNIINTLYLKGLCAYVLANVRDAETRGIVVGHDHRYNSERWAKLTAAVFASKNVKVYLHRGYVHTPLVPFSLKTLKAACGVMITGKSKPTLTLRMFSWRVIASHNPKVGL